MIKTLKYLCFKAIINNFKELHKQIEIKDIDISNTKENEKFHFQLNSSMKIAKKLNKDARYIAEVIQNYINNKIENNILSTEITGPGFINFTLKNKLINKKIKLINKITIKTNKLEKIIIDYSSPNIAKDMHVGHLRSTIVGDCISKMLKYIGHDVISISHLGDWGTQFGILIAYIKKLYSRKEIEKLKINNLSILYKNAQKLYEQDELFKNTAKDEVVKLQKNEKETLTIWEIINNISKKEYAKIYKLLDIKIKYKGESFYNKLLKPLIEKLEKKKIIEISNNAKCIYPYDKLNTHEEKIPLIVQKSDGAFNYATTDLAALYYRIKYQKADKIIYITDVGQSLHFKMIFDSFNKTNLNNKRTKLIHIPLGLMLNNDGKKIKTRSGESEKLITLIHKSIKYAKEVFKNKNKKDIKMNAIKLGINTLKYSDLSNNINQNYIFDYKKILQFSGNTAAFLNYAYVRIISINKKIKKYKVIEKTELNISDKTEIDLALHLLQYKYTIIKSTNDLNPNILTVYLYKLAEKFHSFFHECNIINSNKKYTRLILCKITSKILKDGMQLLGLKIIKKM